MNESAEESWIEEEIKKELEALLLEDDVYDINDIIHDDLDINSNWSPEVFSIIFDTTRQFILFHI